MANPQVYVVPFHGDRLEVIKNGSDGYVSIRPICERLGLFWPAQYRKLMEHNRRWCVLKMRTHDGVGRLQEMIVMPLYKVAAWLGGINTKKVSDSVRPMLEVYQDHCDRVLFEFWGGIATARERAIETRLIAVTGELMVKKPILGRVAPLAQADRSFSEIKAMLPGYSKRRLTEALHDLERLGLIKDVPVGTPALVVPADFQRMNIFNGSGPITAHEVRMQEQAQRDLLEGL